MLATGEPFTWEVPGDVENGETFSLTITCSEPGCTGITTGNINLSSGLVYRGSSSSTSISTISTPSGRQLSQVLVYQLNFTATGSGIQYIGPLNIALGSVGTYTLDEIPVSVTGAASVPGSSGEIVSSSDLVWLEGELRDPGGRIYPGTRIFLDYYIYAKVTVENVTYWWGAPELGVIRNVETIPDSNWEIPSKRNDVSRSKLAVVEMTPAAAGSLYAPLFTADVTGQEYDRWGKVYQWTVENEPIVLPVYPFPENPPSQWDSTLLDSVTVSVEQLPSPPGQGGELSFRITCLGPGNIYMEEPPELSICGNSCILPSGSGSTLNKKWWDYILEPEETGCHVLGPDTLVWLDRVECEYREIVIEPCSLDVSVIPRPDREIELQDEDEGVSSKVWLFAVGAAVLVLASVLGTAARRKDKRLSSVTDAEDLDELLSGLESELSLLLSGKREYLGYEELDELLDLKDVDTLLARRLLRFWKDLELGISDKDSTGTGFTRIKTTAEELVAELKEEVTKGKN